MIKFSHFILLSLLVFSGCYSSDEKVADSFSVKDNKVEKEVPKEIADLIHKVEPFFKPLGKPEKGEWLNSFKEDGQTFKNFLNGSPPMPTEKRQTIYIQPLGKFNSKQIKIINLAVEYLGEFYRLPTKRLDTKDFDHPMSLSNQRTNPQSDIKQVRTGYILDELLYPNLPEDAAALIAFTAMDLFPNRNYNFVFGQASLKRRVGVWSLHRLQKNADFNLFLKRTLKIAVHETGHMFGFYHCTAYSCAMNGTNHIVESDKRPLDFCPEDTAKIVWITEGNAKERYQNLSRFSLDNGLIEDGKIYSEKAKAVNDLR